MTITATHPPAIIADISALLANIIAFTVYMVAFTATFNPFTVFFAVSFVTLYDFIALFS